MKFGFSKQIITPKHPIELCGYAGNRMSTGVHDDLYVKVMLFQQKETTVGILSYDLLAVDSYLKDQILKQIPSDVQLVLTATHTHQGPNRVLKTELKDLFLAIDELYYQYLVSQSVKAIQQALNNLENFEISIGKNHTVDIYSNRHSLDNFYNQRLYVMKIITSSQHTYGLISFSCHPTILKDDNTLFSKDLLWGVEQHLYGFDDFLFINGTAGDISTRFVRQSSDYQQVETTGKLIASTIMTTDVRPIENPNILKFEKINYSLKLKTPRSKDILNQQIDRITHAFNEETNPAKKRNLETMIQGLRSELDRRQFLLDHQYLNLKYSILDLGFVKIVGLPLEVFSVLAVDIFKYHPLVLVASYVDGYYGYLVDQASFDHGVYEAGSTLFDRGEAEKLLDHIKNHL